MYDVLDEYSEITQKIANNLKRVSFYVDFSDEGTIDLFDRDFLYKRYCKDISKYLAHNGITYKNLGPVDKGGGGVETFVEILKTLWHHRDLIQFIFSIVTWVKLSVAHITKAQSLPLTPRITVALIINSDYDQKGLEIKDKDLEAIFVPKLANLLTLGISLCDDLRHKYPYLSCDLFIAGDIKFKNFSARFSLPNEFHESSFYHRYLHIIKNLALKESLCSLYEPTRWLAIQRTDSNIEFMEGGGAARGPIFKKYFLLFSNRLLKDYL